MDSAILVTATSTLTVDMTSNEYLNGLANTTIQATELFTYTYKILIDIGYTCFI